MTHLCVGNLTIIGSDNGLLPGRRQAIIWTSAGILLIEPLGTNFNEIFIEVHVISFKKIHLKMSSGKSRPFCLGLNVLIWGELVQQLWGYNVRKVQIDGWLAGWLAGWIDGRTDKDYCPACRTSLIATRFWVVMICPIIKCLTVLEFSFILFDLCLFITIFNFILNYVRIVTFWILTYHKIWILLIISCFVWSYWIIYFLTCLEVFWSVVS